MTRNIIERVSLGFGSIVVVLIILVGILVVLHGLNMVFFSSAPRLGFWSILLGAIIIALPLLFYGVGKVVGEVLG